MSELRDLIVRAAPDPERARPVTTCDADAPLDGVIPFSSLIVLGVVVAIEDRYRVRVTRALLERATAGGATLRKLAAAIDAALAEASCK
jgi:hypothetical protein